MNPVSLCVAHVTHTTPSPINTSGSNCERLRLDVWIRHKTFNMRPRTIGETKTPWLAASSYIILQDQQWVAILQSYTDFLNTIDSYAAHLDWFAAEGVLPRSLVEGRRVLDWECGSGAFSVALQQAGATVVS